MKTTQTKNMHACSILVVGHVPDLSLQALARAGNRVRHVYVILEFARVYVITDHFDDFDDPWKVQHTHLPQTAFSGHWDKIIAEASAADANRIGQSGRETLEGTAHLCRADELCLISPVRKSNPVVQFLPDLEAVAC